MKKINFEVNVRCWKDKTTGSWLLYSKKYDISAYGRSKAQARRMFQVILDQIILDTKPRGPKPKIKSRKKKSTWEPSMLDGAEDGYSANWKQ